MKNTLIRADETPRISPSLEHTPNALNSTIDLNLDMQRI